MARLSKPFDRDLHQQAENIWPFIHITRVASGSAVKKRSRWLSCGIAGGTRRR